MFTNEPINEFELTPDQVRKGDVVAIVGAWDFHRNHGGNYRSKDGQTDVYYYEVWTVAACGKKIARLVKENETYKSNVWIMDREGRPSFQSFICKPENVEAMAAYLHSTDRAAKPSHRLSEMAELKAEVATIK